MGNAPVLQHTSLFTFLPSTSVPLVLHGAHKGVNERKCNGYRRWHNGNPTLSLTLSITTPQGDVMHRSKVKGKMTLPGQHHHALCTPSDVVWTSKEVESLECALLSVLICGVVRNKHSTTSAFLSESHMCCAKG